MVLTIVYVAVFFAYSLGLLVYFSFRDYNIVEQTNRFIGLQNYVPLLTKPEYLDIIGRTFLYTGVVNIASLGVGLGMALLVESIRSKRISIPLRTVLMFPMFLIPVAGGIVWRYLLLERYGWINFLIEALGGQRYSWLSDPHYAFWLVCLTDVWGWSPFLFLILLAGIETIPTDLFEACDIDGASSWSKFRHITIPLLKPIIYIAMTIKLLDTYKAFDYLWVMTHGGPGNTSMTLNIEGYLVAFGSGTLDIGFGSAIGVLTMLFPFLLVMILLIVRRRRG